MGFCSNPAVMYIRNFVNGRFVDSELNNIRVKL